MKRAMKKVFLWALLVIYLWPLPSRSKVYKYPINRFSEKWRRWWPGKGSNTGNNFGGWLFYVSHVQEGLICGASYYSPLLMIASGNCIDPYRYDVEGTGVVPTFNDENVEGLIDTVYTHPKFRYSKLYMDIALIRLQDPVGGKTTEFIKLCNKTIKPGMVMTSYGWGFDSMELKMSLDLKNGSVPVEDIKSCSKKFQNNGIRLSSTSFCVTHPRDPRKCRYDGGCPLTYGNELCGVVSFGPLCKYPSQPGIYTDINKVTKYIEQVELDISNSVYLRRSGSKKPRIRIQKLKNRKRIFKNIINSRRSGKKGTRYF